MNPAERRRLTILLAVLGFLAAAFFARLLFFGGDDGGDVSIEPGTTAPGVTTAPGGTGTTSPSGTTTTTLLDGGDGENGEEGPPPDEFDVYATKNPFEPVIQVSPPTVPGTTSTTLFPGQTTTSTTLYPGQTTTSTLYPGQTTTSTTLYPGQTTTSTSPSYNPPTGQTVALLDVYDDAGTAMARVRVGSTVYTVGAGDVFATYYRVVSLDDPCGQFLYGDSPFSLCEGEEVIK